MSEALIRIEQDDGVAVLTFHDPERLNAMTEAMGHALADAVAQLSGAREIRAAVLTGSGRAFSAGGDLEMIEAKGRQGRQSPGGEVREANRAFMGRFYRLYLSVRALPFPSIAAINGAAIGAGLCVALACDLRVAAREAKMGLNFNRLGIHPGMGATWTLPRIVGAARAAELLYTGRLLAGEEAAGMGLVNRAVARDDVLATACEMARAIAENAPEAVRGTKRSLARSETATLDEQLDTEAAEQALNYESEDLAEGLAATRDKRTPRFRGA